jgi:hypothetical protein
MDNSQSIFTHHNFERDYVQETYMKEPLLSLIKHIMSDVPSLKGQFIDRKYLFTYNYDWKQVMKCMKHIVIVCNRNPEYLQTNLLIQAWDSIPSYLCQYTKFYPDYVDHRLEFMHQLITKGEILITKASIKYGSKLPKYFALSLDTGLVMRHDISGCLLTHRFISDSKAKTRRAIIIYEEITFSKELSVFIDNIMKNAKDEDSNKYYNLKTKRLIKKENINNMKWINHKFKIIADKGCDALFHHIIFRLNQNINLKPIPFSLDKNINFESSEDVSFTENINSEESTVTKNENIKAVKCNKRKKIPQKIRMLVWREYIGNSMDGKCWTCKDKMTIESWHAGHIIPTCKGGKNTVDNLRPICQSCNLSMGSQNMNDFINEFGLQDSSN